jgi:hypothetical protein
VKREEWNEKYAGSKFLWTTEPNRFLIAEVEGLPPDARSTSPAARAATPSGSRNRAGR